MVNVKSISFLVILLIANAALQGCNNCVTRRSCGMFSALNQLQQALWKEKFPCFPPRNGYKQIFGNSAYIQEDYVCCSYDLWITVQRILGNSQSPGSKPNAYTPSQTSYNPGIKYSSNKINRIYQGVPVSKGNPPQTQANHFNTNNPYLPSRPLFPGGQTNDIDLREQCPLSSYPPEPSTGCCGLEATDNDRNNAPHAYGPNPYSRELKRVRRWKEDDDVTVTFESRIAGGKETELRQFPWTAFLRITFDYGDRRGSFDCGGSLISSRYVLTAGHCVFDPEGQVMKVEVFLAEYDKRTYPKDCKIVFGQGEKCVDNIVIDAESLVIHPQYYDDLLKNDIALIRLESDAPYTDHIRPICLPSINVDTPAFSDLRLAVTGWGRNGKFRSDVKQSTVVNLVPQEMCKQFYAGLSESQLCAAGHNGEDTCKGDSGGPLMTVYGGKYEVVGIVSGKAADSPCGNKVPSLYTNVYHYLDWIRANIKD